MPSPILSFPTYIAHSCAPKGKERRSSYAMSNLPDKAHFLLQMVCAEFTAHGSNNCLKIYRIYLSRFPPWAFCSLSNFPALWLVSEITWPYFLPMSWSRLYGWENSLCWLLIMPRCFFSIPEMCLQRIKAQFQESCFRKMPFLNRHTGFDEAFGFCLRSWKTQKVSYISVHE